MGYAGTVTYGNVTFDILSLSTREQQATRKQKIGQTIVRNQVVTDAKDRILTIRGEVVGSVATLDTFRTNIRGLRDGFKHSYSDNVNTGNFLIADLSFDEAQPQGFTYLDFNLVLEEDQFG